MPWSWKDYALAATASVAVYKAAVTLAEISTPEHVLLSDRDASAAIRDARKRDPGDHWAFCDHPYFRNKDGLKIFTRQWMPLCAKGPGRQVMGDFGELVRGIVFIVHGFGEHSGRYEHVARALTAEGFAVCSMDHQGHGRSEGEVAHVQRGMEDIVDDVVTEVLEVRKAFPRATRLFILGHSMGGLITQLAMARPELASRVDGVALTAPFLQFGANDEALISALHATGILGFISSVLPKARLADAVAPSSVCSCPDVAAMYANDKLVAHVGPTARMVEGFRAGMEKCQKMAHRVKYPLLVIVGGQDHAVGNDNTKEMLKVAPSVDKSFHELVGAEHEVLNEPEDEEGGNRALRMVVDWLSERAPKIHQVNATR